MSLRDSTPVIGTLWIASWLASGAAGSTPPASAGAASGGSPGAKASGVCPPFKLRDEAGNVIDPVHGVNDRVPYSPKQTCGACHDYEKITQGFHFTQGKGEAPPQEYAERYAWITAPGNYGGNWCSPAPLYRQLAPKRNTSARTIDMTSFEFVTATCGNCHPGGGPLEYDREGHRYDEFMRRNGLVSGGDNGLDGDYYKARWDETGVIEADCLLCHMPAYDHKRRNEQLACLNFRWAATEGAGLGRVEGKVSAGEKPVVRYERSRFDADGNVAVHYVPEPRNETCLTCHAKPGWKKRGASFSVRTDVHIRAGLRCTDCHAAGLKAADPRIRGREEHQIGKGDDPSGWVRNDLDNTLRSCEQCHLEGWNNAPRATHEWLPPLHMEKLSCQVCHIPARPVKSALVQASDAWNPGPRIAPPAKQIWTFYDQEARYWNHYGELDLFTVRDQPTDLTRPTLAVYKGKIFPVNRVHSMWVGIEEEGRPGLNQLFMKDFFTMWKEHRDNPSANWPSLARITDDNADGAVEVNRPEEIDALLTAARAYLEKTGFPLERRRLVWVCDDRAYYSSSESRALPRHEYEATPYASVYKLSHDVAPARAALGAGGCTDCHRVRSPFFDRPILASAFDAANGRPRWQPNHTILGRSALSVRVGGLREEWVKAALYGLLGLVLAALVGLLIREAAVRWGGWPGGRARALALAVPAGALALGLAAGRTPDLMEYMTVRRFALDANHFWAGVGLLILSLCFAVRTGGTRRDCRGSGTLSILLWAGILFAAACGGYMLVKMPASGVLEWASYTGFDFGLMLLAALCLAAMMRDLLVVPKPPSRVGSGG